MAIARFGILLALALLLTAAAGLAEDVLHLKNGNRLVGRIVEEDADRVTIELPGAGRMTLTRQEIARIVRDDGGEDPSAEKPPPEVAEVLRSEHFFLWSGQRRIGYRSLWVKKLVGGNHLCEEETVFTSEEGQRDVVVRIVEKVSSTFEPLEIEYREFSPEGQIARVATVDGEKLKIETSLPGERRTAGLSVPEGFRFPLSAREFAVRERDRIEGAWKSQVFDPREENFFRFHFEAVGKRKVDWKGEVTEISVLRRRRGGREAEEIWVDGAGRTILEELNGPAMVAMRASRERVEAARRGGLVEPTEDEKRIRPEFTDPVRGYRVRKPSIAWSFVESGDAEKPDKPILTVSNLQYFAYVEVFLFDEEPEGGLLTSLALWMERRFSAHSKDFEKLSDGYLEVGGEKAYRMLASSRNKGEELRSWLVGVLRGGQTWVVTLACPATYWKGAEPEFVEILRTFEFLGAPADEEEK